MERNLYFENYLDNLQRQIFLIAYDANYEILSFISCYMRSKVRAKLDKPYSHWHTQSPFRIVEEVIDEYLYIDNVKKNHINREAVEWLGFFYSRWHFIYNESSKEIVRMLPPKEGLQNYYVLHQLDEADAIEKCKRKYNLSRNNHRANEYKNCLERLKIYDDPVYYSFLAKRLLYKLNKEKLFLELDYYQKPNNYDFVDSAFNIGMSVDVIYPNNMQTLTNTYSLMNLKADEFKRKADKSIYFCFNFAKQYEDDVKLKDQLDKLRNIFPSSKRKYDYLYFYSFGRLYEITSTNELYVYYLPLSSREKMGIINTMIKLGLIDKNTNTICKIN